VSSTELISNPNVMFLELVPFYSFSSDSHIPIGYKLNHVEPFGDGVSSYCNFRIVGLMLLLL